MRKEVHKINDEDYKLLLQIRNLKEKGITEEEILQLDRNKELSKENKQRTRLESIRVNKMQINHKEREIKYKQKQLDNKECLEKHDDFFDGKKPLFFLESDIERIKYDIWALNESNKLIQEEYDQEEKN